MTARDLEDGDLAAVLRRALTSEARIIMFQEDNALAGERIRMMGADIGGWVVHVNCGFLPTSEKTWRMAWEIVKGGRGGGGGNGVWLHLHENVDAVDIETRKAEIQQRFEAWTWENEGNRLGEAEDTGASSMTAVVEHVEKVKTFAPGVWHCVFDVYISNLT